jgi:rfaE bifunctional protein kinase chain/domain
LATDFSQTFSQFKTLNVIVIGDVMIDSYLWGSVHRISPEAPIPIVNTTRRELRMGGAANVALNIKSLTANPILCTVIGGDSHGDDFLRLMDEDSLDKSGIVRSDERITTIKHRVISGGQHLLRVDEEITTPITAHESEKLLAQIDAIMRGTPIHAVVFEDYDKGVITPWLIERVVKIAHDKNIPVLVDPKKRNFLYYKGVDVFKPNFKELCEGVNVSIEKTDFDALFEAECKLREILGYGYGFITLSEHGVFLSDGESYKRFPSVIREVTDVSGAGDTVIATISLCIAAGIDIVTASEVANIAGGLVCERVGVVPVDYNALLKVLKDIDL